MATRLQDRSKEPARDDRTGSRPVPLRLRPDLVAREQQYLGRTSWVVKDPLALKYFRFQPDEYALLKMIDGRTSLEEMRARCRREFRPARLSLNEVQHFIGRAHREGLLISDMPGQGRELQKRQGENRRKRWVQRLGNVLAIRFRGIDPGWLLNFLYPLVRFMFRPWAVALWLVLALSALLLIAVQWSAFQARMPALDQFFSLENAIYLGIALIAAKIVHELGHGLTCQHFGGECHEIGLMLLVFMPCLYCNVSDAWMIDNKWRRAAVGAAGMYVEVLVASLCTFLWWFSEPGLLNHLCLSLMFVCSVSTVVFNGNPLLRFDGYYILSDLVEIPNLQSRASGVLRRVASSVFLGMKLPEDPFVPQKRLFLFALYSVASFVYRWFVYLSILWFLTNALRPYRLEVFGHLLLAVAVAGFCIPLVSAVKFFMSPGRTQKVKKTRAIGWLVGLGLVGAALFVPLPYFVICPLDVQPHDGAAVYVDVAGSVAKVHARPGERLMAGQPIIELVSLEAAQKLEQAQSQLRAAALRYDNLLHQRHRNPEAASQLPQAQEELATIREELAQLREDEARLTLRAGRDGVLFAPPRVEAPKEETEKLPSWSGSPFETHNVGCFLPMGSLVGVVGEPAEMEAVLVIDQADVELVRVGQEVELQFAHLPGETFRGRIDELAVRNIDVSPANLSHKAGGELVTKTDESGRERPQSASYQAKVHLLNLDRPAPVGIRGQAKISAENLSVASRVYRWLARTFRFRA
ncbi:MAG: hemolysin D [Planctomycetia bacterium]|nr:hemolysin D [Planctomycetia bacterium]